LTFKFLLGETLARYITDPKQIRPSDNTIRHYAFMPPKVTKRLSVYYVSNITETEIWKIGNDYVAPSRGKIIARADLNSRVVYETELSVDLTGKPHPRHADIVGWSEEPGKTKLQAMKLAGAAISRHAP